MSPRRVPTAPADPTHETCESPDTRAGGEYQDDGSGPQLVPGSQTVAADLVHRARVLMQQDATLTQDAAMALIVAADAKGA